MCTPLVTATGHSASTTIPTSEGLSASIINPLPQQCRNDSLEQSLRRLRYSRIALRVPRSPYTCGSRLTTTALVGPRSPTMNPSSQASATSSTTTSVRSRNRRLNSVTDEELGSRGAQDPSSSARLISPVNSPRPSRAVSPIPSRHPSRAHATRHSTSSAGAETLGGRGARSDQVSSSFGSGLWGNSWSTLQGLASTVLGNDGAGIRRDAGSPVKPPRRRWPIDPRHTRTSSSGAHLQWGPAPDAKKAEDQIGIGSLESREAMVRAKRREDLLSANGTAFPDSSGQYKRRLSDDRGPSFSAPPTEHERDADKETLVYLHPVQPHDTLAGVIIQFNCDPAAFRRANRLWPNDTIQTRKTVVLPVDACGVKGRPMSKESDAVDLLTSDSIDDQPARQTASTSSPFYSDVNGFSPSITSQDHHDEPPWKHDSWVKLDDHPAPVEIVRLPCRRLGFFPPSRRKSVSFSDLDTPPASLDLGRPTNTPPRRRNSRSDSTNHFVQKLHGPGGVGTLSARTTSPGPGLDQLNKYLAPHLPNVAPRDSFESEGSNASNGLDHVGSAIEGWVRKMATRAAAAIEHPGPGTSSGRVGAGDLIELSDGIDGSDDGIGRGGEPSAREDLEGALRERFPMRGRVGQHVSAKKGD